VLWTHEICDSIAVARYDNPPLGYFCAEGTRELGELVAAWRDPGIRAVILCGPPGRFITHYSVEELLAFADSPAQLQSVGTALNFGYYELLRGLRGLAKPVLVALTGDTMGGGFELSLSCDIRIAAQGDYRYGLPEAAFGILPGGCGTQRLSRLLGAGRAIDFILRARICTPEEALQLGLVHEIASDPLARALEIARSLVRQSPVAMAQIKRAVYQGSELHLEAGLEIEAEAFLATMVTQEARDAMKAYVAVAPAQRRAWLEKRLAPHLPWRGPPA
jgi:enoyl-CoA hydratase/carnithine racemase